MGLILLLLGGLALPPNSHAAGERGFCEAREASNPAWVSYCGRFHDNSDACAMVSQFCQWTPR
jgi:hypothetical protein